MDNQAKALAAIKEASGTELGEYSVDAFISHHLEELPSNYWEKHLGTASPTTVSVMGLLILRSKWDDSEVYDFTLPEEVTDYVVSVSFDEEGEIEDIAMES
jgi:hypothetical protein